MHNAAWEAVDAETAEGPAAADAAVGSGASGFPAQAGTIPDAAAGALAVQEQLKWDGTRPNIHRSYVQHLAAQRSLQGELMAAEKAALVQQLAAQPRHCSRCGSLDMQALQPAPVLFVSTNYRYSLEVPRHSCCQPGCGGTWAPSPFVVGCFPATPKASWDVLQCSPGQPARWFDLRLLQLADGLIFQGRPAAIYSFAQVVHRLHEANGAVEPLGWEHFKRQLGEAVMVSMGVTAGCFALCLNP